MEPDHVTLVTPVYQNQATLGALSRRVAAALDGAGRSWRLRFVVDGSPDASLAVASRLAEADHRLSVLSLAANVGQNAALLRGLAVGDRAGAWVCLDADLQDPPEAVPVLLDRLGRGDVGVVFGGRRGAYEGRGRLLTGALHRAALSRLVGVPVDAGAFLALDRPARDAVVALNPPSVVAGAGAAGLGTATVPVERSPRPSGRSAWTPAARLRQSGRALAWAARNSAAGRWPYDRS